MTGGVVLPHAVREAGIGSGGNPVISHISERTLDI